MRSLSRSLLRGAVVAGLVAGLVALAGTASAAPGRTAAVKAPSAQQAEYVGQETCLGCHEGKIAPGAHARAFNPNSPAATQGCESCHGPGKAHVDAGGDITQIKRLQQISASEASESCTTCHDRKAHALWAGSQHDTRNVGCLSCHSVHSPKSAVGQLKAKNESELCASCHRAVVNKQNRFNHMPVREGKMACASCHNVHGSANVKLLKAGTTVDESCTSCHQEKRGPYLWEHAPVSDACVTCHDPHGSNNERMLVAKQPFLCQRCHVTSRHPPTVYDNYLLKTNQNANKIYGRSCVVCHQMVHGSNSPNGKAFLR